MPTFDDPRKDADEAFQALRGLAHASRNFTDPADTYPVIGDLLGGVRALRQVLDQLAAAHLDHRVLAHNDAGDQSAGATSALAAADELHQAGTLLDTVEWQLDAASQHSGRIAWKPTQPAADAHRIDQSPTTATAGTLTLTVWPDTPLGEHQRYGYRIEHTRTGISVGGRDLFTGTGSQVPPQQAIRELAGHLIGASEAYFRAMEDGSEYRGMFTAQIADAALTNIHALTSLSEPNPETAELSGAPDELTPARKRWISVVFLDGAEGDKVLDLIHASGTDAAIEHLAGYDYGDDTVQDALANGYVYDAPPRGALDKMATKDVYTLTYSPFLGHVSLLREYDAAPDPALLGIDTPEPAAHRAEREPARARREATDWFARRPSTAATSSRGLAL